MYTSKKLLSDIVVFSKYAKYLPTKHRRETWDEIVDRNIAMHSVKYPHIKDNIVEVFDKFVRTKKVLMSLRSAQFAGKPIELAPNRMFNCGYLPVSSPEAFSETMFLLLGGTGVGYSVQGHHVAQLPRVRTPMGSYRYLIPDDIEGWASAIKKVVEAYLNNKPMPRFDYRGIRDKGSQLITAGGKAPGPQPLQDCITRIQSVFNTVPDGGFLRPIDCHDIMCHIADAVLSGGIRRSACIALFDRGDTLMLDCKSGSWWEANPQRARANNSAVLPRSQVTEREFKQLWERIKSSGSGEPGIYFTNNIELGTNP
jgi:ribonucleoside-triphosphate reductase